MKASLDTNVIIHFYKANLENILFEFFDEGLIIYEQIRNIELNSHGQDILGRVDEDIRTGKIEVYTNQRLKELFVFRIFEGHVKENRQLYTPKDMGEVYAISLAQTLGTFSVVTDDIKVGGPYKSLLQLKFDDEVMPFNFVDILILRYLLEVTDQDQTVRHFNQINEASDLKWSLKSHVADFYRRFCKDPYKEAEVQWIQETMKKHVKSNKKKPATEIRNKLRTLITKIPTS